jgi:amidase
MNDIVYASAKSIAKAIKEKEISSCEVVEFCLKHIEKVNPKINAVVCIDEEKALLEAKKADDELSKGHIRGPLHGVPMTIKDNLDTAGMVTTGGTKGRESFIPKVDATVVSRLREAGAILVGKTNTPELTLAYETDNLIYGRTNNPYDFSRTSGGSSGGASAILAAGGIPFDIGSDTGGSIRLPSHFCGTAGIRPTSGRVPRTGHIIPPGGTIDALTQIGPMSRMLKTWC